jgi:HEAT repeat protein
VQGTLKFKKSGNQTLGEMPYKQYEPLKHGGTFMPSELVLGNLSHWKNGEKVMLFARYDDSQKRLVAVGRLPATPANIAKVKQLVKQTPDFQVTFSTDKKEYALGEAVIVRWNLKNVSPEVKSLYTGEYATNLNLIYPQGWTPNEDVSRERPPFTQVKPGQSWVHERRFDGEFPVGELGIEWFYNSADALKTGGKVPQNIAFLSQQGSLVVKIQPPSAAQTQQLISRLDSPRWNEQLEAAQTILKTDDPAQWKKLEAFASHPYAKLREIAAEVLTRSGSFSPALKTLFYSGTNIKDRSYRKLPPEFALALLASVAVEEEARARGFKGVREATQYGPPYGPLDYNGDPSIGDILAERLRRGKPMEGGINNGVTLLLLSGLRNDLPDEQDHPKPLSKDLEAKVFTAWSRKRETVKTLFTPAQLNAEIALARKVRYDDYQTGPYYQTIAALLDEGSERNFLASPEQDEWDKKLSALPKEAVPDLLRALKWREMVTPPISVLRFLVTSSQSDEEPQVKTGVKTEAKTQVYELLMQIAYGQGRPDGDTRIEAIRLMALLDPERAKTHIENFLTLPFEPGEWSQEAPRLGAAIALAALGNKRGVPIIFSPQYEQRLIQRDNTTVGQALKAATGREFPNLTQWQRWWEGEGQKMEWK